MKKHILMLVLALSFFRCSSDRGSNNIVENFFSKFENEGSSDAIDYLFSTNKWMKGAEKDIKTIKSNLTSTVNQLGDYHGYKLITTKKIDDCVKQYHYLVKYDLQPIRFTITLYKPKDNWRAQNFEYDSDILEELREQE